MPRLVRHDAEGPIRIEPQDKPIFICACGLSQNLPYCDGSHKTCRTTETPGTLYVYDKDRRQIVEEREDD
jgi:CDGSH-type Zn-finger protein